MKYIIVIIPILLLFSCTNDIYDMDTIDFSKFKSDAVIIKDSYDQLIAKKGTPDDMRWTTFRRYNDDGFSLKDSTLILSYYPEGIMYVLNVDSVRIYRINFDRTQGNIYYGNLVFNRGFTMNDALKKFEIEDLDFFYASDYSAMIGFDSSGYLLSLFPEPRYDNDSYTFYFGEDSCLKGINFPIYLYENHKQKRN